MALTTLLLSNNVFSSITHDKSKQTIKTATEITLRWRSIIIIFGSINQKTHLTIINVTVIS